MKITRKYPTFLIFGSKNASNVAFSVQLQLEKEETSGITDVVESTEDGIGIRSTPTAKGHCQ